MSRPLRIEYPHAWYHVMNRGRRGDLVFADKRDYQKFVGLLQDTTETYNLRISAFCFMPNHYHLLVQTPDANLSRCMRHIDGVYTQRFNRTHHCDGSLFRGRYKAILLDADSYLLQLVRYIHRNPLRGGITDQLDGYAWSSHQGYLSRGKRWNWLHKEYVLSLFSENTADRLSEYRKFVSMADEEELSRVYERKKLPSILGPEGFVDTVKEAFFSLKTDDEIPESRQLAPDPERIKKTVCELYGIDETDLLRSRRGVFNEPRNVAIYLTRRLRGDSLKEIGDRFRMDKYSSVSSVIERVKALISEDPRLRDAVQDLINGLSKSQEQT